MGMAVQSLATKRYLCNFSDFTQCFFPPHRSIDFERSRQRRQRRELVTFVHAKQSVSHSREIHTRGKSCSAFWNMSAKYEIIDYSEKYHRQMKDLLLAGERWVFVQLNLFPGLKSNFNPFFRASLVYFQACCQTWKKLRPNCFRLTRRDPQLVRKRKRAWFFQRGRWLHVKKMRVAIPASEKLCQNRARYDRGLVKITGLTYRP